MLTRRKCPKRYPMRFGWQSCVSTRIWDIPANNCFVALCELADRTKSKSERRVNSIKCDVSSENKPPKSHLPAKLADTYTEFNQGVRVDIFVLADSNEQVFEFLDIVDLATRFNICFPVPSKRPDDVFSVLQMVWINGAGPMSHLISDMGGEFEGELGECMDGHGIRQYFKASEGPWQNGRVERNGGIWKAAARKTIRDVGARGFVEIRRLASMMNWAKNARINSSGCSPAQWVISVEGANCHGHCRMRSKVPSWPRWSCQIVRLSSVDECKGCGLQDTSHRLRRALLAGVRASSHTQGIETGEPVVVWRRVKKTRT